MSPSSASGVTLAPADCWCGVVLECGGAAGGLIVTVDEVAELARCAPVARGGQHVPGSVLQIACSCVTGYGRSGAEGFHAGGDHRLVRANPGQAYQRHAVGQRRGDAAVPAVGDHEAGAGRSAAGQRAGSRARSGSGSRRRGCRPRPAAAIAAAGRRCRPGKNQRRGGPPRRPRPRRRPGGRPGSCGSSRCPAAGRTGPARPHRPGGWRHPARTRRSPGVCCFLPGCRDGLGRQVDPDGVPALAG
jgi:hypothetical protein